MNIRELRADDYKTIYGFIINEMEHSEVSFIDLSASLDLMKSDNSYMLFVAEDNNQVVGFVSAVKLIGCIDSSYIEIGCLVVSDNYQKRGGGKLLLEYIESLGKSNGIKNYSITSGLHRKNAHKFYEHNGYEKGGYAFYKGLVILKKDE